MNFSFSEIAEIGQSRHQLPGNEIHEVTFDGCEARDIKGVKNPDEVFKVIDIKFSNENGYFTDTIWCPKPGDDLDAQGTYGPNPSNNKHLMVKILHLLDAVNPEIAKRIRLPKGDPQRINLDEINLEKEWDKIREFMAKATDDKKGITTKIKLIDRVVKNSDGSDRHEGQFPRYFLSYSREGRLYMSTNFIGNNTRWTDKELKKIKAAQTAAPTSMDNVPVEKKEFNFDF